MAATLERLETLRLANEAARHAEHVRSASPGSLTTEDDLALKELQVQRHIRDSSTASTKATLAQIQTRREQLADTRQVQECAARAALAEAEERYADLRAQVIELTERLIEARFAASTARAEYDTRWANAHDLGVAVNPRIERGGFPAKVASDLQIALNGARSGW